MAICQYFLRGNCRFGNNCRNEHPANAQNQAGFGNQSWNNDRRASNPNDDQKISLPFTAESITNDLTPSRDKPLWPLSSYAPAKHEPLLLAGLDESPEELRVKAFTAKSSGNINEYMTYETNQISAAENFYENARSNPSQAYDQSVKQSSLPALIATVTGNPPRAPSSAFGTPVANSAFGVPAAASAFATPTTTSAFGVPTTSTFGNPSSTASAFGNPNSTASAAFGNPGSTTSAFGNPSSTASVFGNTDSTTSAFGNPSSAFGKPAFGQSTFGQPQATPSTFGQTSQPVSAFGQSSFGQPAASPAQGSAFIKPSSGAFGAYANQGPSAFAAPNTTNNPGGGFSTFANQPSAFGPAAGSNPTTTTTGSAFGQTAFGNSTTNTPAIQPASAFGTPAFGAPSAFGALAQQQQTGGNSISAFGNTANPVPSGSAFGTGASGGAFANPPISAFGTTAQTSQPSPFGQPQPASPFGGGGPSARSVFTTSSVNPFVAPSKAKAAPDFGNAKYHYRPGLTPYDSQLPPNYSELLPESALTAFRATKFEWGKVPEWIPPIELRALAKGGGLFS